MYSPSREESNLDPQECKPSRLPYLIGQLERLERVLESLIKDTELLMQRTAPICRPIPSKPRTSDEATGITIVDTLASANSRLEATHEALAGILETLEI